MKAEHRHKPTVTEHLPRRVHTELWCEAERAIKTAIERVEAMPASTWLSIAIVKLDEAFDAVANYVDEQEADPPPKGWHRLSLTPPPGNSGYPYDGRYVLVASRRPEENVNPGGSPFALCQWTGRCWTPLFGNGEYMGAKFWAPVPGFEGVPVDA